MRRAHLAAERTRGSRKSGQNVICQMGNSSVEKASEREVNKNGKKKRKHILKTKRLNDFSSLQKKHAKISYKRISRLWLIIILLLFY